MDVDDRLLLHKVPFPGTTHAEMDHFMAVTIVEKRLVPHMWGKGESPGFKARGEDGRFYFCNWDSFPDDSTTPYWMWFMIPEGYGKDRPDLKAEDWYDITQGLMAPVPAPPIFLEQYKDTVGFCQEHQCLFRKGLKSSGSPYEGVCFKCYLDKTYPNKKEEAPRAWKGWF